MKYGITSAFKESTGEWSMRRVLAFILVIAGIASGFMAVRHGLEKWAIVASFGVPIGFGCLLLLFTTWEDVKNVVVAVRK